MGSCIAERVGAFLRHMPEIQKCETQLLSLDDAWEHIKRLAEVTCPEEAKTILPSMERTQNEFKDLQGRLLENLVTENLRKASSDLASKAQVAIDILIRNLYERTADVGFLATDADIVEFLGEGSSGLASIVERLRDYVAKYSVYEEIVLFDASGTVKANIDEANAILGKKIVDPIVAATLSSDAPYIETFRHCSLQEGKSRSLIYSKRIEAPGQDGQTRVLGGLCLCFKIENELDGIFKGLKNGGDRVRLAILDVDGSVIAASDQSLLPAGTRLESSSDEEFQTLELYGREYLVCARKTKCYQGYCGPGWTGCALHPCDSAFKGERASSSDASFMELGDGGLSSSLSEIVASADLINLGLRRVVWNGQVMSGGEGVSSKLKPVLAQISKTGARTISLFSDSIKNLRSTIVSASLANARAQAHLAIDIMDRNLYERSDDCRWWALTGSFRRVLASASPSQADFEALSKTLAYINGLYTVYYGLFVYDRHGEVVAVSNDSLAHFSGRKLSDEFVQRTLQLQDSQRYSVSAFAKTPLYADRCTYIYGAPILDPEPGSHRAVGGIGIVFDSEPQFEAMLLDALPSREGGCAFFADRDGRLVASTLSSLKPGDKLDIDPDFFKIPNGEALSKIVQFGDKLCIAGCACSSGYREYKNSGDYKNDVLAFVLIELCDALKASEASKAKVKSFIGSGEKTPLSRKGGPKVEIACFSSGGRIMAFEKGTVIESLGCEAITGKLPGAAEYLEGTILYHGEIVPVVNLRVVCGLDKRPFDLYTQVVVTRLPGNVLLGVLVDDLDSVPEFDAEDVQPVPKLVASDAGYVKLIAPSLKGSEMTLVLDPELILKAARSGRHPNGEKIERRLKKSEEPAPLEMRVSA